MEHQLRSRLDRIARADKRLLDAYQAEVLSLAELTERRRQLGKERQDLERQQEERARLRLQRLQAEAVRTDLTAFCSRIRGRAQGSSAQAVGGGNGPEPRGAGPRCPL